MFDILNIQQLTVHQALTIQVFSVSPKRGCLKALC